MAQRDYWPRLLFILISVAVMGRCPDQCRGAPAGGAEKVGFAPAIPQVAHRLAHESSVYSVAFSPDGKVLAAGTAEGSIHLWSTETGKHLHNFHAHEQVVKALAFTADGKRLVSGGLDRTVRLWEVATRSELRRFGPCSGGVVRLALSPDSRQVAAAELLTTIHLWELDTGREVDRFSVPGSLSLLTYAPDGSMLLAGGSDSDIHVLPRSKRRPSFEALEPRTTEDRTGKFWSATYTPDGTQICGGRNDGRIFVWDARTGKERRRSQGPPFRPFAMSCSPDGRMLALGCTDGVVRLWEVATTQERGQLLGHARDEWIYSIAFSPDGQLLASGSGDQQVLLWDLTGHRHQAEASSKTIEPSKLERLWADLGSGDAARAYQAMQRFLAVPGQSVPFLEQRLHDVARIRPEQVRQLIGDLDNDRFQIRRRASRDLRSLGELVEPVLREAIRQKLSLEARHRIEQLLAQLEQPVDSADRLKVFRGIEALEALRTPEAIAALEKLARGAPAWPASEARLAVDRLDRRSSTSLRQNPADPSTRAGPVPLGSQHLP
jgi:WD40 repeat protein